MTDKPSTELQDALDRLTNTKDWGGPSDTFAGDIRTVVAAARKYEALVRASVLFATETGKRINDLILKWAAATTPGDTG